MNSTYSEIGGKKEPKIALEQRRISKIISNLLTHRQILLQGKKF
jgi:hypothetical protein